MQTSRDNQQIQEELYFKHNNTIGKPPLKKQNLFLAKEDDLVVNQ